jgi:hypothetical protein
MLQQDQSIQLIISLDSRKFLDQYVPSFLPAGAGLGASNDLQAGGRA